MEQTLPYIRTLAEITIFITGVTCVYLQTREKVWAWPFGIISVSVSVVVFYHSRLYSDVLLHVVYIILNVYGWINWSRKQESPSEPAPILHLQSWGWLLWIAVIAAGTAGLGYIMEELFDASLSYFDAFTTSGSLVAQFLLARKVIQNWLIWIVVDVVAVGVYVYKEIYIVAGLFLVYLVLCLLGYVQWRRKIGER